MVPFVISHEAEIKMELKNFSFLQEKKTAKKKNRIVAYFVLAFSGNQEKNNKYEFFPVNWRETFLKTYIFIILF